jgi:hypothetical protein
VKPLELEMNLAGWSHHGPQDLHCRSVRWVATKVIHPAEARDGGVFFGFILEGYHYGAVAGVLEAIGVPVGENA